MSGKNEHGNLRNSDDICDSGEVLTPQAIENASYICRNILSGYFRQGEIRSCDGVNLSLAVKTRQQLAVVARDGGGSWAGSRPAGPTALSPDAAQISRHDDEV